MGGRYPTRLLIVEDDQDHAAIIRNALARWARDHQSTIELVSSASEALEKLCSESYDLVLTDFRLPDKTGVELLAEIKNRKLKFPVLLMTAASDELLAANALSSGFMDYIVKSETSFRRLPETIQGSYERFLLQEHEEELKEELAKKTVQLRSMDRKLEEVSVRDELTALYNHRFLQEKIAEEFSRASRYHHSLSCLMVDIDHFRTINDAYGHLVGDGVLRELAQFFTSFVRQADAVARYGGEEFVILLPHVGYEGSHLLAERLRKKIMETTFCEDSVHPLRVSVSIGVASYPEDPVDRKDTLLFYADRALYRAKGAGRNRVYLYRNVTKDFAEKIPALKFSDEKVYEFRHRLFDVSEMAKRAYIEATKALVNALEAKDPHTMGHAARVGHFSALVAKEMGLGEDDVRIIEHAGLLHDIGKICISDEILLKPGAYTHDEYEKMKLHPVLGYQIVKPIKFLSEEALIILHHHEWYNGEGYPQRLKGKEIPLGARIVSVLDAYDTMRAAGARYKKTLTCQESIRELIHHAGTQFDPQAVFALVKVLLNRGDLDVRAFDREKLERLVRSVAA